MIRRLEIENFMSLKSVSVDLNPLTVFVGPNGSGKSAIFKALTLISKLLNVAPLRGPKGEFQPEIGVTFDDLVWGGNSGLPMKFRIWFDDDDADPGYSLELKKGAEGWSVVHEKIRVDDTWITVDDSHSFVHPTERLGTKTYRPPLRATLRYLVHPFRNDSAARGTIDPLLRFADKFGWAWRYRPSAIDIASFVKHPTDPESSSFVRENGFGVAFQLQTLQGSDRERFEAIERAVCQLFPHIRNLGFKTEWQGVRLTFNTDRSEDPIPAPQESDGVLLATFLFWRLFTGGPALKICLEEPENGLHPLLLADRFRLLKKFTTRDDGTPTCQILLATHSPEFLRIIKAHPNELWRELRLVEFSPARGTSVKQLDHYREATTLIERYLDEIHERWAPVVEAWR